MLARLVNPRLAAARAVRAHGVRTASTSSEAATAAQLNTKRPDFLLSFKNTSTVREVYHYTSYALAGGIPIALIWGVPMMSIADTVFNVAIPLHFHIGMRSVLVDYVHNPVNQRIAFAVLAGATVMTALGIFEFNRKDVGLTQALCDLWVEQPVPESVAKKQMA